MLGPLTLIIGCLLGIITVLRLRLPLVLVVVVPWVQLKGDRAGIRS